MIKTLSIIIPVYFNEESITPLYKKLVNLESKLNASEFNLQLIFVDDGSEDLSFKKLLDIKKKLSFLSIFL